MDLRLATFSFSAPSRRVFYNRRGKECAAKMVSKELVRELIGDYTPEKFVQVLKRACQPSSFASVGKEHPFDNLNVRVLGVVKDLPSENGLTAPLLVVDVPLSTALTERSSRIRQFKLARKVLEHFASKPTMELDGVIAQGLFVFHDDEGHFRVSLVTATPENGKFNWSKARRQSFYVTNDPDANATFVQRMCMNWSTFQGIKEAFSVEKLTEEFYDQLFKWYERACDDERVEYPNGLDTDADNREDKNRKHLLRLITRLMFVWFLKQKGLVPGELFDEVALAHILKDFKPMGRKQHQYYRAILQNLFFATLNSEIDERGFADSPSTGKSSGKSMSRHHGVKTKFRYADEFAISRQKVLDLFRPIPFLNGGLFECLDQEDANGKVMYYDGFSMRERHRDLGTLTWAHVPNDLFFDPDYGIIPLLKRYNFTVEENTPGDEDVALDPELLGKVFENLLGAYNPETQEVVRKSTGSFYTPREIVNYMVDESLIAYLAGSCSSERSSDVRAGKTEDAIRSLVTEGVRPTDETLCDRLIKAIETAKVIDPACGSGAFPMGALLKMTELLRILKKLPEGVNLYDLKLRLIENCIFGSDIQEIAVQISKLRVFISLVCEQKPDPSKPNHAINTLPNLETKFVAANSLIGIKKRKVEAKDDKTGRELSYVDLFEDPGIQEAKDKLREIRHKHFAAKTRAEKNALRKDDKTWRDKLANLLVASEGIDVADANQLASWDPYNQNVHAEFFDPEWMFNVKDGFDIVIGNPPYIQLQANHGELADLYAPYGFETFARTGDIYCLFYEKGWQLLRENGHLCYITSNKWMRNSYGEATRKFFVDKTQPRLLIDFAGEQIFDSATVETNILLFEKNHFEEPQTCCSCTGTSACRDNITLFVETNASQCTFHTADSWVILSPIEQSIHSKIAAFGIPLQFWDVQINYGIKTGYNEAFIVDEARRAEILSWCRTATERNSTDALIRPILRGRDIKRYSANWPNAYLITTHNGYGDVPRINVDDYPAIKRYLDQFWDKLSQRGDKGVTPYNLRNCAYMPDFAKSKIIWGEISDKTKFALDSNGEYVMEATTFLLVGPHLKFLVGYLNSSLAEYLFSKIGTTTGMGTVRWKKYKVEQLLVPKPDIAAAQTKIIEKVDAILLARESDPSSDTSALEREIDQLVYQLYGLTDEEIAIVEGANDGKSGDAAKTDDGEGAAATLGGGGRDGARPSQKKKRTPKFEEEF